MCVCRVGCGEVAFEPYMACLKLIIMTRLIPCQDVVVHVLQL